uniref:G-protein coupled receptors family 1 profile domain-containing protein n=1 Tax=Setaria digitata TaxID=48799 RepID=A0A915PE35_9BILA
MVAERGNMIKVNGTWQCVFLDLPSYTIYSATGSFFIPLIVMFFVYYKIYQAFARHRARQLYRQQVIKKHIESTILHELSHVVPTNDEFVKEMDENEEREINSTFDVCKQRPICKVECDSDAANEFASRKESRKGEAMQGIKCSKHQKTPMMATRTTAAATVSDTVIVSKNNLTKSEKSVKCCHCDRIEIRKMHSVQSGGITSSMETTYERMRHQNKRQKNVQVTLQHKPRSISAAKERRGVKVFGIILGCFAICWTPFFIMYVVVQFCSSCKVDPHIWMFITWLGYSNSAMNPIIYTVFNRDYQNALKGLFRGTNKKHMVHVKR